MAGAYSYAIRGIYNPLDVLVPIITGYGNIGKFAYSLIGYISASLGFF